MKARQVRRLKEHQLLPIVGEWKSSDYSTLELIAFDYAQIQISSSGKVYVVKLKEITHLKVESNYCTFYLQNGTSILASKTLKFWTSKINSKFFLRTHSSILVNKFHISSICNSSSLITTSTNVKIPISRSRRSDVLSQI